MWDYTPRQLQGWMFFASRRQKRELADRIAAVQAGARGDPREVKKMLKDLRK